MKTPKEIIEYLKKQSWYDEFVSNVKDYHKDNFDRINDIINGHEGELTIQSAFIWKKYKNHSYWSNIDDTFVEWYNS